MWLSLYQKPPKPWQIFKCTVKFTYGNFWLSHVVNYGKSVCIQCWNFNDFNRMYVNLSCFYNLTFISPWSVCTRCGFRTGVPSFVSRSVQPTPRPTAPEVAQVAATTAAPEERRAASQDPHQMTMSPKNLPAAQHLTARPPSRVQPMAIWEAPPAWAPAQLLPTAVTPTAPALRCSRGWRRPAGPAWVHPTQLWLSLPSRLRRSWRPGSRRTVWPGPSPESCPPSTENPTQPSRQTCSEAQGETSAGTVRR